MKINTKFLSMLAVFALLAFVPLALAEKGGKGKPQPPAPPPTPVDPAIVYLAGSGDYYGDLMVMNADGSNRVMLLSDSKNLRNSEPSWSPDASQIVFVRYVNGERWVSVIDRDGQNLHSILHLSPFPYSTPRWSPGLLADGKQKILFGDAPNSDGAKDLFLVNLDGTGLVNLTNTPDYDERMPTWNSDGTQLAAMVVPVSDGGPADLIVYDVQYQDGVFAVGVNNNLTAEGPLKDVTVSRPSWAKTQDRIAVSVFIPDDPGDFDLWVIDVNDPTRPVRLTETSNVREFWPDWSPDDTKIVYRRNGTWNRTVREKSGIFVMDAEGSEATGDSYPSDGYRPDWRRCCPTCDVMCAQ